MGRFSTWSYTSTLTIWPVTTDAFNQPAPGEPYQLRGTWKTGGRAQRDDDNIEFIPSATFWFEIGEGVTVPVRQWLIAEGNHTGEPPDTAEPIRKIEAFDNSQFEAGSATDYRAYT